MRVHICAVGRLRKGPERDLYDDYLTRFDRTGRALAFGPAQLIEVEDKKGGGMPAEAALLERAIPTGCPPSITMVTRPFFEDLSKIRGNIHGNLSSSRSIVSLRSKCFVNVLTSLLSR